MTKPKTKLTRMQKLERLDYYQAMATAGIQRRPALVADMTGYIEKFATGEHFAEFLNSCYPGLYTRIKITDELDDTISEYVDTYLTPIFTDDALAILPAMLIAYEESEARVIQDQDLMSSVLFAISYANITYIRTLITQFNLIK